MRPKPVRAPTPAPMPAVTGSLAPPVRDEPVRPSPVVSISDQAAPPEAQIRCPRCQGLCGASARYCKYCGGDLQAKDRAPSVPPAAKAEAPAPAAQAPVPAAPIAAAPVAAPTPASQAPSPRGSDWVTPTIPGSLASASVAEPAPRGATSPSPVAPKPAPAPAPSAAPVAASPSVPAKPTRLGHESNADVLAAAAAIQKQAPARPTPVTGHDENATTFIGNSAPTEDEPELGRLVVLLEDGSEGRSFGLTSTSVDVGRSEGEIILPDDPFVSPRHARLRWVKDGNGGRWLLRDLGSTNGVYARIRAPITLESGDLILLGLQVLQFRAVSDAERGHRGAVQHGTKLFGSRAIDRVARLEQRTTEGTIADVYSVFREETFIGREVGDIVFTHDPFLSRRHAVVRTKKAEKGAAASFSLEDLGSSNGTYVAIKAETPLEAGDRIRIGQHLFRLEVPPARAGKTAPQAPSEKASKGS